MKLSAKTIGSAIWRKLFFIIGLLALGTRLALALEGTIGIHDPSTVIVCDGKYYVYGTGRGISVLTSSNGFNWQRGDRVFDQVPPSVLSYVPKNNGSGIWAPDIIHLHGIYYLYYAVSFWGSYVSAVGLVTSPTLDPGNPNYKWTDCGMVVHSSEGENLNAIDPGVCLAPDGTLWLCYGSYHGNIELVQLDPQSGLRVATNAPVSIIAGQSEASEIIYHAGCYQVISVQSGNCLAVEGANVDVTLFAGNDNQLWKIDQLADGSYRVASKLNQLVLTALIKETPGNGVGLQAFTGANAQRWVVTEP